MKITVIATGFQAAEIERRGGGARPTQVAVPASAPVSAKVPVTRAIPPPLPAGAVPARAVAKEPVEPIRLNTPAAIPVTVTARAPGAPLRREPGPFKPIDEDQYDIPAFLRNGRGPPRE